MLPMTNYEQLLLDSLDKRFQDVQLRKLEETRSTAATVWLLGVHERANMGDMALTYTAEVLLRRLYPRLEHVTISRSVATHNWQKLKLLIRPNDLIFMPGGGNMGDLWLHEEAFRRLVVKTFHGNPIVVLPQSVHFDSNSEIAESAAVYGKHERLFLFARDEQSLAKLEPFVPQERRSLAPDLAFSYEYPVPFSPQDKEKVLVIARSDKEEGEFPLQQWARETTVRNLRLTDTTYSDLEYHGTSFGAKSIYRKIDECHSAGVVITNRLHGVIFGLLAGRPVIAYETSYGKIGAALAHLPSSLTSRVRFLGQPPREGLLSTLASKDDAVPTPRELLNSEFVTLENRIRRFIQSPTAGVIY